MKNKPHWIEVAEVVDSLRIFPRLIVAAYCYFVYQVTFYILVWYATQPAIARGTQESAVVGIVITAVTGFSPWIFKIYIAGGRSWDPPSTTTTASLTTQVTSP